MTLWEVLYPFFNSENETEVRKFHEIYENAGNRQQLHLRQLL